MMTDFFSYLSCEVKTKEIYRFPNGVTEAEGRLTWDVDALLGHVRAGIDRALDEFGTLESFSIDTWGCDYVLLKEIGRAHD